jgi:acetoin utilization deacetylase AcuC-like enzyme
MKCSYHAGYVVPLSPEHPFPMSKYELLKGLLVREGVLAETDLMEPAPIPLEIAAQVHTADYLAKLSAAALTPAEVRRLGLPWTASLWDRSQLAAGGTLLAARTALDEGLAANLAGGTHHAFADHGEGFCVLNDVAIAIVQLRAEGTIRRALILDLDVHQGNGTAAIFAESDAVFTFSMHGEKNYPATKMRSTLDVGLPDGIGDEEYLATLARHLPQVLERADADIAFYVAGVDVVAGDRYGKLALSEEGLRAREQSVIRAVRSRGLPLVIVLAGGYAPTRERTAELHAHVIREACAYERGACADRIKPRWPSSSP